jgi:glycine/D-amino acid oxidase-like deaminating enzyme
MNPNVTQRYNLKAPAGGIIHSMGACWPYRLITTVWSDILAKYPSRLSIETHTPVTEVSYSPESKNNKIMTPRGEVSVKNVIYATNGYTTHLLPSLAGCIFPLRGTMSVHRPPKVFGRQGDTKAWSYSSPAKVVEEDGRWLWVGGLYYSHQNAKTGDVFIGGERGSVEGVLVGDDSGTNPGCKENLEGVLPRLFDRGWDEKGDVVEDGKVNGKANGHVEGEEGKPGVKAVWSGIMGFTPDHLPFVGRLPSSIAKRGAEHVYNDASGGEFIAAGFNGYGMAHAWSAGEALALTILGRESEADKFLPVSYKVTEERIRKMQEGGGREIVRGIMGV